MDRALLEALLLMGIPIGTAVLMVWAFEIGWTLP